MKKIFSLICISLLVPSLLLLTVFFAPEVISNPVAKFSAFPVEWLIKDREMLRELTSIVLAE